MALDSACRLLVGLYQNRPLIYGLIPYFAICHLAQVLLQDLSRVHSREIGITLLCRGKLVQTPNVSVSLTPKTVPFSLMIYRFIWYI